ncbi:hypothetical protein CC86DRAFT_49213, partial [Ophiobolus disseminans]
MSTLSQSRRSAASLASSSDASRNRLCMRSSQATSSSRHSLRRRPLVWQSPASVRCRFHVPCRKSCLDLSDGTDRRGRDRVDAAGRDFFHYCKQRSHVCDALVFCCAVWFWVNGIALGRLQLRALWGSAVSILLIVGKCMNSMLSLICRCVRGPIRLPLWDTRWCGRIS